MGSRPRRESETDASSVKILILTWKDPGDPEAGGNEVTLLELARRLAGQGHSITWFTRRFQGVPCAERRQGIRFVRIGGKWTVYFQAYRFYRRLQDKPDVVMDVINVAGWLTPLYVREPILAFANQLVDRVFFCQWPFLLAHLGRYWERFQYRWYRDVPMVCYSPSVRKDMGDVGIPDGNILPITLGVDHQRYLPGAKSSTPLFICVSRLANWKRIDACIRAMPEVCRKHPTAKLVVVGKGPAGARLKRLVARLRLAGKVEFADQNVFFYEPCPADRKIPLLQQSWALLQMSIKEGWGLTISEANACGTLAIVSGAPGLRDNVRHMHTGLVLAEHPTTEEIARAMCLIIENPALRAELEGHAVQNTSALDWRRSAETLESYLFRVAPKARPNPGAVPRNP